MPSLPRVIILGAGVSGYTAAIYTARAAIDTVVITGGEPGGQLATTSTVENFPGFPDGILGPELLLNMKKQAEHFGTKVITDVIKNVDFKKRPFLLHSSGKTYETDAVIICTGASANYLGLPEEKRFIGRGVTSCATCDGFFYKNKEVIVVGGGDTAMEEAMFLTKFANKVYLVHRRDAFRASKIMIEKAKANEKIEFMLNATISSYKGKEKLESVEITNTVTGEKKDMTIDGVFMAIGHNPNTAFLGGAITLDEKKYIVPELRTMTNIPGVFAAGDVVDSIYRQAISAAGDGCRAAIDCKNWLENLPSANEPKKQQFDSFLDTFEKKLPLFDPDKK